MTSQKRAKRGGEVGPNGEHYQGGAFIATTELPKTAKRRKGSGKVQVGPYEWAVPPTETARPLYIGAVGGVFADQYGRRRPLSGVSDRELAFLGLTREELASLVERHAAGERWQ